MPDNALAMEAMDGLIASAPALCRFLDVDWPGGEPREADRQFGYWGSLPGTLAIMKRTSDGYNIVVLVNNRGNTNYSRYTSQLFKNIEAAVE